MLVGTVLFSVGLHARPLQCLPLFLDLVLFLNVMKCYHFALVLSAYIQGGPKTSDYVSRFNNCPCD